MADIASNKTTENSHIANVQITEDRAHLTVISTNEKGRTSFMRYIVRAFEPNHGRYSLSATITFQKRVTTKGLNRVETRIQNRFISFTMQNLGDKLSSTQIIPENQKPVVKLHTEIAIQMLEDQAPRDEGAEADSEWENHTI